MYIVMTGVMASISFASYNQVSLVVTQASAYIYTLIRSHFWITSTFRYLRFNFFFLICWIFICIFARTYARRDREKFKSKMNQRHVLMLLSNLIKTHHDGILITETERIVFHNAQVKKIFDID